MTEKRFWFFPPSISPDSPPPPPPFFLLFRSVGNSFCITFRPSGLLAKPPRSPARANPFLPSSGLGENCFYVHSGRRPLSFLVKRMIALPFSSWDTSLPCAAKVRHNWEVQSFSQTSVLSQWGEVGFSFPSFSQFTYLTP